MPAEQDIKRTRTALGLNRPMEEVETMSSLSVLAGVSLWEFRRAHRITIMRLLDL